MIVFLLWVLKASGWQTRPPSFGSDRGHGVDSRFLRGDKAEGGPVELAVTARDPRDQPVPDHAHRRHRDARSLGLGKRQAHILEHEGQDNSGRVRLPGNLDAVNYM